MKTIFIFLSLIVLISCNCISQLPTQIIYTGNSCTAILPNYLNAVSVSDNCEVVSFTQTPAPGFLLDKDNLEIQVTLKAIDNSGNENVSIFNVILFDTISPVFHYPDSMLSYSVKQISEMFLVFEKWQQENIMEFMNYFNWQILEIDTIKYTNYTIQIPDSVYYAFLNRQ